MSMCTILRPAAAMLLLAGSSAFAQPQGYMTNSALDAKLRDMANHERAALSTIGESLGGSPLHLLKLGGGDGVRPALLIVAGIDAQHLASTEVAARIADRLLNEHQELLDEMTVFIIPRANPDGAARNMSSVAGGHIGNARLVDEDRDRMLDEDHADDLNSDGVITMMRRLEPTLEDSPTHMADPEDQRLNIKPDMKEGQRAQFTLYPEGLDNDGDGSINEDGFGAVDINMNFMHRWPEHDPHAGRHALSEPEAHALARFVLDHDELVAVVTIGKHDNLINQPDSKKRDITGRSPLEIDASDAALYQQVGEWFKDATGMASAAAPDSAGSFHTWVYAQRGLPSFAINAWARPDEAGGTDEARKSNTPESGADSEEEQLTPSPVGDISMETLDELREAYTQMTGEEPDESMLSQITPAMVEQFAAQAGIEVRRIKEADEPAPSAPEAKKKNSKKMSEDAKWLAYFEEAGIDGFVDWEPFDHPTLGRVEIGGFRPGAKINPPADQLEELAGKHADFVVQILESRPVVQVSGPELKELGGGLYEVRLRLTNEGELPTSTVFSRSARSLKPTIVRLSVDVDDIIDGQRVDRVWGLDQHGGSSEHRWVFRAEDIDSAMITIIDPRFGTQEVQLFDQ